MARIIKSRNDTFESLFREYVDRRLAGKKVAIEDYVKKCPERAEELEKRIKDWEEEFEKYKSSPEETEAVIEYFYKCISPILANIILIGRKKKICALGEEKPKFEIKFQKPRVLEKEKELQVQSKIINNKLIVFLSSKKYKTEEIEVILWKISKSGKKEMVTSKTTYIDGSVDFGEISPGKYGISIPNLQEKPSRQSL